MSWHSYYGYPHAYGLPVQNPEEVPAQAAWQYDPMNSEDLAAATTEPLGPMYVSPSLVKVKQSQWFIRLTRNTGHHPEFGTPLSPVTALEPHSILCRRRRRLRYVLMVCLIASSTHATHGGVRVASVPALFCQSSEHCSKMPLC